MLDFYSGCKTAHQTRDEFSSLVCFHWVLSLEGLIWTPTEQTWTTTEHTSRTTGQQNHLSGKGPWELSSSTSAKSRSEYRHAFSLKHISLIWVSSQRNQSPSITWYYHLLSHLFLLATDSLIIRTLSIHMCNRTDEHWGHSWFFLRIVSSLQSVGYLWAFAMQRNSSTAASEAILETEHWCKERWDKIYKSGWKKLWLHTRQMGQIPNV